MEIKEKTIEESLNLMKDLMISHLVELNKAYVKAEKTLAISMGMKFEPDSKDKTKIEASINFVTDRVKDSATAMIDENQMKLFDKDGKEIREIEIEKPGRGKKGG